MAVNSNRRSFFACLALAFAKLGTSVFTKAQGVQSISMGLNFNLDYIFEIGQINVYQTIEGIPDVEIQMTKVIDGNPPLYCLATNGATSATLNGRSSVGSIIGMAVYSDQQDAASGSPLKELQCSGSLHTNFSYSFNVDGPFTESISFLAQNRVWNTGVTILTNLFDNTDAPINIATSGGVQRRQNLVFAIPTGAALTTDVNGMVNTSLTTILPPDVEGISSSGINNQNSDGSLNAYLQSINISVDLQREALTQLGKKLPYYRYPRFPVECRTEIVTNMSTWDTVSATDQADNTTNRTIKIKCQEGLFIDMGTRNRLNGVNLNGGGVDGSLMTATYNYTTFSTCTVTHPRDPSGL